MNGAAGADYWNGVNALPPIRRARGDVVAGGDGSGLYGALRRADPVSQHRPRRTLGPARPHGVLESHGKIRDHREFEFLLTLLSNLDGWAKDLHALAETERGGSHVIRTVSLNLARALNGYNKLVRVAYGMPLPDGLVKRPGGTEPSSAERT